MVARVNGKRNSAPHRARAQRREHQWCFRATIGGSANHKIMHYRCGSREAVDGDQLIDHRTVSHRRSIPFAGGRIGIDLEGFVRCPDPGPAQVRIGWSRWHCRHEPSARIVELRPAIGTELDAVAILVDKAVVVSTLCRVPGYAGYEQLPRRERTVATRHNQRLLREVQELVIGTKSTGARGKRCGSAQRVFFHGSPPHPLAGEDQDPSSGLCRVDRPRHRREDHATRHNQGPGIMQLMPGPA
jgi:hypothetical protein